MTRPALLAAILLAPTLCLAADYEQEMLEDARLNDVHFVDTQRGWAVGDRGVIWHTSDGGRHWRLQTSGTQAALRSVFFVNRDIGWTVGGVTRPLTHTSRAIVLRTRDGGRTWRPVDDLMLPGLKKVRFFDQRRGWAAGDASAMFPSGVFYTDDGGRTWTAVAGTAGTNWHTAHFLEPRVGLLLGDAGATALAFRGELKLRRPLDFGPRRLHALHLSKDGRGWMVGDEGLVLKTEDGGLTWQVPRSLPPRRILREFNYHSVATHGSHVWIAGSPGSFVLHSDNRGGRWRLLPTGQATPIHSLAFHDQRRGHAVGSLGTILVTDDGLTWRVQRTGGRRAALLVVAADADRLPWELVAGAGGGDGYLTAAQIIGRTPAPRRVGRTSDDDRAHDALVAAGGCDVESTWHFPLLRPGIDWPAKRVLAHWNRVTDGRGSESIEEHLVRKIRLWRPDVVVTGGGDPQAGALAYLVRQLVLVAVEKAADREAYPEQLSSGGLRPWHVKKVFARTMDIETADVVVSPSQIVPRLGRSLEDQASIARGLTAGRYQPAPAALGFRLLASELTREVAVRDLFSGIALEPGGEARRQLGPPAHVDLSALKTAAQKKRNVERLIARVSSQSSNAWLGQVNDLTRRLPERAAGDVLYQLADHYRTRGEGPLAAETFELLLERYPDHPLASSAATWLLTYFASEENAWRLRRTGRFHVQQASFRQVAGGPQGDDVREKPKTKVRGQQSQGLVGTDQSLARYRRALKIADEMKRLHPELLFEPSVRFAMAAAQTKVGTGGDAEDYFHRLASSGRKDAWQRSAQGELWLARPHGRPPKPIWKCARTTEKPYLDGRLNDRVWATAKRIELSGDESTEEGTPKSAAMLAYDEAYLYFAVVCEKADSRSYSPGEEKRRGHDAELKSRDRVQLFIDIDRDYGSYFRLSVDHRGLTAEDCAGDIDWNPRWHVASEETKERWIAEIAIPLPVLTGKPPRRDTAWAVGVQRIVPAVGLQSWTHPADIDVRPEGFGYLIFE